MSTTKYSIIIPTLWKSKRIHKLLSDLIKCEFVDEIILIDNAGKFFEYYEALDKVKLIQVEENIYVNPAWNLGIELAKNECIALCNDDINFNPNIFGVIDESILTYVGIIGMGEGNYKDEIDKEKGSYIDIWEPGVNDWGWGCLILLKKSHWLPIPNEIKIWYGDNIIKDVNSVSKGVLRNFKVETEMSTTSDGDEWNDRKKEDHINFINYLRNGKTTN
jgi:glycosyltransferase involved in cell wall biosynthesis